MVLAPLRRTTRRLTDRSTPTGAPERLVSRIPGAAVSRKTGTPSSRASGLASVRHSAYVSKVEVETEVSPCTYSDMPTRPTTAITVVDVRHARGYWSRRSTGSWPTDLPSPSDRPTDTRGGSTWKIAFAF